MEHYSALKKKDIVSLTTTWMHPEDTILTEIRQSQKDKIVWFQLHEALRVVKFRDKKNGGYQMLGKGEKWRVIAQLVEFCMMKRVCGWKVVTEANNMHVLAELNT